MWKLYDDLYIGIPSGILITGCAVGEKWTTVRIDGNIGIARTMGYTENAGKTASQFLNQPLRDVACHMRWDSPVRSSIGVAALNAWYNTADRVKGLNSCNAPTELSGKTAYVGDFSCGNVYPVPDSPDFDESLYTELAEYDNVVIASEALITRALPGLLKMIGEDGNVILEGPSLPVTALFFSFGMPIREIRGVYSRFSDTVEGYAINNISDLTPGVLPFCVRPPRIEKIHESEILLKALSSPYKAAKFNNNFI